MLRSSVSRDQPGMLKPKSISGSISGISIPFCCCGMNADPFWGRVPILFSQLQESSGTGKQALSFHNETSPTWITYNRNKAAAGQSLHRDRPPSEWLHMQFQSTRHIAKPVGCLVN